MSEESRYKYRAWHTEHESLTPCLPKLELLLDYDDAVLRQHPLNVLNAHPAKYMEALGVSVVQRVNVTQQHATAVRYAVSSQVEGLAVELEELLPGGVWREKGVPGGSL